MDGGAIPHDQQLTRNVPQHMRKEAYNILTVIGLFLDLYQQLTAWCDRTDCRQVIVATGRTHDRWLTDRRPGAHQGWQQIKACFIYPDKGSPFAFGFFLISGHFSLRQCSMAASLRSVARS